MSSNSSEVMGVLGGLIGVVFGLVMLILCVLMIVSIWKMFTKMGEAGWKCLIPFYNTYVWCKAVSGKGWWWAIIAFAGCIPAVGSIVALVFIVYLYLRTADVFGKGVGFAILTLFFPYVCFPILGLGKAEYNPANVNFFGK